MQIPNHIGIIMDGNRRWARAKNLSIIEGHREGSRNLKRIALHAFDRGIQYVTVYAFSAENWNRPDYQVADLMQIFREGLNDIDKQYAKEGVRLRFSGNFDRFPKDIRNRILNVAKETHSGTRGTLVILLGYGGKQEIVNAVRTIVLSYIPNDDITDITEDTVQKNLYLADVPDPDLIIRTGGQQRLSNFLVWQSPYSELFFTNTLWPAFKTKELDQLLKEFNHRKRNFGK